MAEQILFTDDGSKEFNYYPPPVSRKMPGWSLPLTVVQRSSGLGPILYEIYQALHAGLNRLAAMGLRALLERLMIMKVNDLGSFAKNLDAFHQADYISLIQRDTLSNILELGHGTIHRGFQPNKSDITLALDIIEGVMAPLYHHQGASQELADRIPPRPPRKKS